MDHNTQVDITPPLEGFWHCATPSLAKFSILIESDIIRWVEKWLAAHQQRVLLDGESSDYVPVSSGVPQGTVLGPLMFLIYVNDITENISSKLRLFADADYLLYRSMKTEQDSFQLQKDLDTLSQWATIWQMRFNPSKCTVMSVMRCTRYQNPLITNYFLCGSILSVSHKQIYFGVTLWPALMVYSET